MIKDNFEIRHNGPRDYEIPEMCKAIGVSSVDELIEKTIPGDISLKVQMNIPEGISEFEYLNLIREIASENKVFRSYIGRGYYGTITPSVIVRNILENPSWYTSYTPYQAEISQGRLEALLNYQTVITELTGMEIANASLLDEATAAAEAMIMMYNSRTREKIKSGANALFADINIFPQTLAVVKTRAYSLGIEVITGDFNSVEFDNRFFGAIIQYPDSNGNIHDYGNFTGKARNADVLTAVTADLMSLIILTPPGQWNADIVFGSAQRFGLPLGFGGPHAAFFSARDTFKRNMPGRIIGVSVDSRGNKALRMALQTREQHIKRERATSNICTAQALLATMAGMYAVYHGPQGLKAIASKIHAAAVLLQEKIQGLGFTPLNSAFFDTLRFSLPENVKSGEIENRFASKGINLNYVDNNVIGLSVDETITVKDINDILEIFHSIAGKPFTNISAFPEKTPVPKGLLRKDNILQQMVFKLYHSETELMRYIKKLERKDFSLTHCMISLGSCTMKLNAATEMFALSYSEFASVHPFVPENQAKGYHRIMNELGDMLKAITGFDAVSFQPNSGAAGEYAGLMVMRKYFESIGEPGRKTILIPASAHGTNPASAAQAGMDIVVIPCDEKGNIHTESLEKHASENSKNLCGLMVTYPSTHGVFENNIREIVEIIHRNGGLVYMDGANMNAQVGLTSPAFIGADLCHLNLHKTFAIPHGGGGPGAGPLCVTKKLEPFLPKHPVVKTGGQYGAEAVAAAPFGSAMILTISHAYCKLMGGEGLTNASKIAILNANYIAASLKEYYDVLYTGVNGYVAHEMILDCRKFKDLANITETDIAKRLMDYGFHAPTLSFPVHGTLMVEPTESESLQELDRFIGAMKSIHSEIMEIKNNIADKSDNVLKNAPHTLFDIISTDWNHGYSRSKACFPLIRIAENKFFPSVNRVDDAFGDRNLVCTCDTCEPSENITPEPRAVV